MSYYELPAEGRGYYLFEHRRLNDGAAHFHSALEFVFVERGKAEVNIDGESRTLNPGEACFSEGFRVHAYHDTPDNIVYVLLGDAGYFQPFFLSRGGRTFPKFFSFSDFRFLETLHDLCSRPNRPENLRTTFAGVTEILLSFLAETVSLEEHRQDRLSAFVCNVLRYAEANIGEDLSLSALSSRFGYSREHLSRILHKYLTESWSSYVNRLRVKRADALLKEKCGENVLKIAYECGFDSPNTFYRAYKKEFGFPPGAKRE